MTTADSTTTAPAVTGADPAAAQPSPDTPSLLGAETTPPAAEAKPGEGEAKPDTEAKADEKPAAEAEIKYEFKPKDGVEFDTPQLDKFTALAKEHKLPADVAQKIVDLASEMELERVNQHTETVKGWLNEVKTDKELGGDKLAENLAVAKKTFDLLPAEQSKELKTLLNQTGLEANPLFFRLFHAVGKALSEDKFVPGGTRSAAPKSQAERLYPQHTSA